mgnify:CR=1 FL=1
MNRHVEIMQHLFKLYTFTVVVLVSESSTDTLQNELRGTVQGNGQTVALQQCSGDDTGKRIPRSGIMGRQVRTRNLPVNPEKPDVPLNKNDAFQKVQKRRVQEKR